MPGLSAASVAAAPRSALVGAFERLAAGGQDGKQQRDPCLLTSTATAVQRTYGNPQVIEWCWGTMWSDQANGWEEVRVKGQRCLELRNSEG